MDQGYDVNLIDCIAKKYTVFETVEVVREDNPDYIMCELTTPTCTYDYDVIKKIKRVLPNARVIAGGTHATVLSEQVLENCPSIDVIARQEYDYTIDEIISNYDNISEVSGITYRDTDGKIIRNPDREWLKDIDDLPMVSKVYEKFLNVNDYGYSLAATPLIQILSARGCPFHCNFCSYPQSMSGRKFRARSVGNFVDEIEYISKNMPYVRDIFIEDDTFTANKSRVVAICDEIIRRGLKVRWYCNTRVDTIDDDMMKHMKAAGCQLLVVGYESGNQKVLDETKKGIYLEDARIFARNARKNKLKVFGCFMIGLKGDNKESIKETFSFANQLRPDMVFFQQAVPFPGTEFYQWVKDEGYLWTEDYSKWIGNDGSLNCLVDYPYASHEEIEKIRDRLMSKYYFTPSYVLSTLIKNLRPVEFRRIAKAGIKYIGFRLRKKKHFVRSRKLSKKQKKIC